MQRPMILRSPCTAKTELLTFSQPNYPFHSLAMPSSGCVGFVVTIFRHAWKCYAYFNRKQCELVAFHVPNLQHRKSKQTLHTMRNDMTRFKEFVVCVEFVHLSLKRNENLFFFRDKNRKFHGNQFGFQEWAYEKCVFFKRLHQNGPVVEVFFSRAFSLFSSLVCFVHFECTLNYFDMTSRH